MTDIERYKKFKEILKQEFDRSGLRYHDELLFEALARSYVLMNIVENDAAKANAVVFLSSKARELK